MRFVLDIDGTICFDGQKIEKAIVEALEALIEAGHTVVFASARPLRDIAPVIPRSLQHCAWIGGNGAFYQQDDIVETVAFDETTRNTLCVLLKRHNTAYLADGQWAYAYTGDKKHAIYAKIHKGDGAEQSLDVLQPLCKLVVFEPPTALLDALSSLPVTVYTHHAERIVDISPQRTTKYDMLKRFYDEPFIVFGNDANDESLFRHAQMSVCVGNHAVGTLATKRIDVHDVAQVLHQLKEEYDGSDVQTTAR